MKESAWKRQGESTVVAVPPDLDQRLDAAMKEAGRTLESARRRWQQSDEASRTGWSVKWAAPTLDGDTEYVWVLPRAWSRYRVEGVVAAQPRAELASGKVAGDIVGFPIDEVADWMCEACEGPNRGGFTVSVLEEVFGPPESTDR